MASIINFLSGQGYTDSNVAWTPDTPQHRAVTFLADQDELQLEIPTTPEDGVEFVQRFAALVFYYSVGVTGPMSSVPTCDWSQARVMVGGNSVPIGLQCNDKGYMHKIYASKLHHC